MTTMRRTVTTLALCAALALPSLTAAPAGATAPSAGLAPSKASRVTTVTANARIGTVLAARTKSKVLGSKFTMTVWDTDTDSYIYKKRASASLRAASTTKILTAVGVLSTLGPNARLATTVRAGATANEVVLVAGGDPLLSSANLRTLAGRTIVGVAAAAADPEATPITGTVTTAQVKAAVNVLAGRKIVVRADDSLFGDQSSRAHGWKASYVPTEVRMVGAFARDDNESRNATSDAGTYFAKALKALGVKATYSGEAQAGDDAATLATYAGHKVSEAVSRMLLISDNDTAEMLFRLIAVGRKVPATWKGARTAQAAALADLDIPLKGVEIVDGSGLSLDGRLTAGALTSALNRALSAKHPELSGLRGWLPVAGRTGTLKASAKRFSSAPSKCAAGRIQAKTGTVADAIALAGYATGADGDTKIFVAIVNARPTKYTRATTRLYVDRAASSVTGCW